MINKLIFQFFILFLFSCEFNTEKIPNFSLKKNGNSIMSFLSSSEMPKNNEKAHQKQNTRTIKNPNLLYNSEATNINNVQHLKKDDEKDKKKATLKQEANSSSDNPLQLNQLFSDDLTQKKEEIIQNSNKQQLSEQNSKLTKNISDYNTQSGFGVK